MTVVGTAAASTSLQLRLRSRSHRPFFDTIQALQGARHAQSLIHQLRGVLSHSIDPAGQWGRESRFRFQVDSILSS